MRVGGTRVGVIDRIEPVRHANGDVTAQLRVKLDTQLKPLPKDSTVLVRPRSALGLKYVEITKGTSRQGYPDGGEVPLRAATPKPVEFDEVLATFDDKNPRGLAREPDRVRQRPHRPRPGPQPGARGVQPAAAHPHAGDEQPRRPAHPPAAAHPGARAGRVADRAGRRGAGRDVPRGSSAPSPRSPTSAATTSWRSTGRPARSTPRSAACRRSGRSWPTARRSSASCGPAPARCAPPLPTSPARSRSAPARCAARSRSTAVSSRRSRRCSASPRTRWWPSACAT